MTDLPFAQKYDREHAARYLRKHESGFMRRLSDRLENHTVRRALSRIGRCDLLLDLPCGTGRFWRTVQPFCDTIIAADLSVPMLHLARARPGINSDSVISVNASGFSLPLPDNSMDVVMCMRLLHHIGDPARRRDLLEELARVSSGYCIASLWVTGNLQANRRIRLENRRQERGDTKRSYQNRFVISDSQFEEDIMATGFRLRSRFNLAPGLSMWRTYLLEKA